MKYRFVLPLFILMLSSFAICAQNSEVKIALKAKYCGDGIMKLRWVPTDIETWNLGLTYGYEVSRIAYIDSFNVHIPIDTINGSDVILIEKAQNLDSLVWKHLLFDTDSLSKYDKLAAGAVFSKGFSIALTDSSSFSSINQVQTDKENRYNMALLAAEFDFTTALRSGLGFIDSTVIQGYTYFYYVKLLLPDTLGEIDPGLGLIKATLKELPEVPVVNASGQNHSMIVLWDSNDYNFISYQVGIVDSSNIEIRSELPIMGESTDKNNPQRRSFADSVALLNTPYYYVVRGIDNFGDFGPWSTEPMEGISKLGPVPAIPQIDSAIIIDDNIQVNWSFDSAYVDRLIGFGVLRSESANGNYTQINTGLLNNNVFEFEDTDPLETNYYIIVAVDEDSNQLKSYPILKQREDTIPPEDPATPTGTIDKLGKVSLEWTANSDIDIAGYRVYACNNQEGEYTQVTKDLVKTNKHSYQMDINNLQKKTYVKIRAYDKRSNQSQFSDYYELSIPDVVPPQTPNIISVKPETGAITIKWTGPEEDVNNYVINRRVKGKIAWEEINSISSSGTQPFAYSDTNVVDTKIYEYSIMAQDEAGNYSYSPIATAVKLKPEREAVDSITITSISGAPKIFLWWVYPDLENVTGFKVYRQMGSLPFKCVETMSKDDLEYTGGSCPLGLNGGKAYRYYDDKFTKGNTYKFKVIAIYDDGTQSPLGEEASVNITN